LLPKTPKPLYLERIENILNKVSDDEHVRSS
jgi:hypothetical protein